MGNKIWKCAEIPENSVEDLITKYKFPRPIAVLLAGRGVNIDTIDQFLKAPLKALSDPYRFPDMEKAVRRLWEAIKNKEQIIIHGDYDTDGITATVLLQKVLRQNGADILTFVPDRFDDGYGFTPESLDKLTENGNGRKKMLVTVDCGITSNDAVKKAKELNIDVIITDHHEPTSELPDAFAIINAKIHDSLSDLHVLSGVGTAFKLSHAFIKYGRQCNLGGENTNLNEVLDLVALGTVADIVPLFGENRILVKHGIKILKKQIRPGVRALIETSKIKSQIKPSDITFRLAPRINAAGRLGDADVALKLLNTNNIVEAYKFANTLEKYNSQRQMKEEEIYQEAIKQIYENYDINKDLALIVAGENWHQGVIGIVASKLTREYNRPAIVLTIQENETYGSGRSIGNLNMFDALSRCSNLLNRFGGHPMAVGLALDKMKIKEFCEQFTQVTKEYVSVDDMVDYIDIDGEVQIDELDANFFRYLEMLEPFGHSNPQPVFMFKNVETFKTQAVAEKHSRGLIKNHNGSSIQFIAFNRNVNTLPLGTCDIVATPQINDFRRERNFQLQIIDIQEK